MRMRRIWLYLALVTMTLPMSAADYLVLIGTYTQGKSKGIYSFRFDSSSGQLTPIGLAAEATNPSFLAIHPNRKYVYAVSEIDNFNGKRTGAVSAFTLDRDSGKLTFLNQVPSQGDGPCFVSVDATGRNVLVANYGGGSVAVLPIGPDGRLREASSSIQHTGKGTDPKRQEKPHAHSINLSPDNRFAIATDLGLDEVLVYRFDANKGTLTPNDPPYASVKPGSGPRHFTFHPNGRFAYVINEMASTVTGFRWDKAKGVLTPIQTITTLPPDFHGETTTAEVRAHPSGKFLYGSNRGHDSIAAFSIDPSTGALTTIGQFPSGGKTPRNFNIDPTGAFLIAANQDTDNLAVFRIDPNTGKLTPTGLTSEVGRPVCVKFVPMR
jgi:6-phosphogluconolactonase